MYNMRLCSRCQHNNPSENRHCGQCGSLLETSPDLAAVFQPSVVPKSFGWPSTEATGMQPAPSGGLQHLSQDLARCPQCASSQTQSFEMAYSVSTTSGVTAGGAYTFGVGPTVGASRSVQQSNLASYVRPPIQPTANNGCLIALGGFIGACIAAPLVNIVLVGISPGVASAGTTLVWIGTMVGIIVVAVKHENTQQADRMSAYQASLAEWRRWWICLRCGHRWKL
jgi:ribosomal protein L40E